MTTFNATVGGQAVQQNVTITNGNEQGGASIVISEITVTGDGFSLTNPETTTLTIAAGQEENVSVTFTPGELTGNEYTGTLSYKIDGAAEATTEDLKATLSPVQQGGDEPAVDPEEEETEEKEEVNDFFSRKDVTGEVIRVFEEDYWPVDFVNVEPDKFAIMPGEGVELDCMFGDASIPAAETTTEPEGSGD